MQLVYATEQREREFQIADSRNEVPTGARVYATCTDEATVEQIGEVTFQSMTDEEFYALRAQVREARQRAQQQAASSSSANDTAGATRRNIFGRLFGR